MSFANEYIQKYGERAIQIYKKSLRHSDNNKDEDSSPSHLNAKDTETLRNNHLKQINQNQDKHKIRYSKSKSVKSIKNVNHDSQPNLNKQNKHKNSKSLLEPNETKTPRNTVKIKQSNNGVAHTFNSIHLNLQSIINPQKKKLLISQIQTPKQTTPNKNLFTTVINTNKMKTNTSKANDVNNINVYVNAYNRSKEKDRDILEGSRQKVVKSKKNRRIVKKENQFFIIKQLIGLLSNEEKQSDKNYFKKVKQKLVKVYNEAEKREKQLHNYQQKFNFIKQILVSEINECNILHGKQYQEQKNYGHINENKLNQRINELEHQVSKYKEKEVTLIKIIESLTSQKNTKHIQQNTEKRYSRKIGNDSEEEEDASLSQDDE